MPSFMNTLGAISRLGQWRFRHVFRSADERGRLDITDAGLIDFSTCSEVLLTVTPRAGQRGWWGARGLDPVMTASLAAGSLFVSNPGLYDVRVFITIGPETEEIFCEPVELA